MLALPAMAGITIGGDAGEVSPDPTATAWTSSTPAYIGINGTGSVSLTDGSQLTSASGYLAYNSGSHGTVSVSGNGSVWSAGSWLYAGRFGTGVLEITGGGKVSNEWAYVGSWSAGSSGTVRVSGRGSTWTNSSTSPNGSSLSVGGVGSGLLEITDGGTVSDDSGSIGANTGSNGTVRVNGAGSTWTNNKSLSVGNSGTGSLQITNGGRVISAGSYVGYLGGSAGTVSISGAGSAWTNSGDLALGSKSTGVLSISDGASASTTSLSCGSYGTINLHVTGSSMLVVGNGTSGTISNRGTISFYADSSLAAGPYHPISNPTGNVDTLTWTDTGASYKAFGGTWDSTTHTFTVGAVSSVNAGQSTSIGTGQRVLVTSGTTDVGASFGTVLAWASPSFSATPMSEQELSGLTTTLKDGQAVLGAWDFSTDATSISAMLSFKIGPGASSLQVWHYSGNQWSAYDANDLTYSNGTASFSVNGFSGYAVTGVVPEPMVLGSAAMACCGLLLRRQHESNKRR